MMSPSFFAKKDIVRFVVGCEKREASEGLPLCGNVEC